VNYADGNGEGKKGKNGWGVAARDEQTREGRVEGLKIATAHCWMPARKGRVEGRERGRCENDPVVPRVLKRVAPADEHERGGGVWIWMVAIMSTTHTLVCCMYISMYMYMYVLCIFKKQSPVFLNNFRLWPQIRPTLTLKPPPNGLSIHIPPNKFFIQNHPTLIYIYIIRKPYPHLHLHLATSSPMIFSHKSQMEKHGHTCAHLLHLHLNKNPKNGSSCIYHISPLPLIIKCLYTTSPENTYTPLQKLAQRPYTHNYHPVPPVYSRLPL